MYLDELRDDLEYTCGVRTSLSTIWRTLKRSGFTRKKVCSTLYLLASSICNEFMPPHDR
jgi:hypothetical protein